MTQTVTVLDIDPVIAAVLVGVWICVGMILIALLLLMLRVGKLEKKIRRIFSDG